MSDLLDQFDHLNSLSEQPGTGELFSGIPLSGSQSRHLARDTLGRPAILFRVAPGPHDRRLVSMALENLHVEHKITCRIATGVGQLSTGEYSIIRCVSSERSLHEYFLNTLDGIVRSVPDPVTAPDVGNIVETLIALFHSLRLPSSRSTIGLWGEMFLILRSAQPRLLLEAWHADVAERYDFCCDDQRLEVKASSDRSRRHHFSFEQAYPPNPLTVIVASLYVEQCTQGVSLGDLWDRLRRIAAGNLDLVLKLERVCIEALGDAWHSSLPCAYDWQLAAESLSFYSIDGIPRVPQSQPIGVDDIHFRSDLGLAQPTLPADCRGTGRLLDAMFGDHSSAA